MMQVIENNFQNKGEEDKFRNNLNANKSSSFNFIRGSFKKAKQEQ
jgi:hypothetical protein